MNASQSTHHLTPRREGGEVGIDDGLYDGGSEWRNIQEPVVRTFDALTQAVRSERTSLSETKRSIVGLAKKTANDVNGLESKLNQVSSQISQLASVVEAQNSTIASLTSKFDHMTTKMNQISLTLDGSKLSQSDQLYGRIQSQLQRLTSDVDNVNAELTDNAKRQGKLERDVAMKVNQHQFEETFAFKTNELDRKMSSQVLELRQEVGRCASKDDLSYLAGSRAQISDLRDVAIEVSEKMSRNDLNEAMNDQIRPVVSAIASLEKAMQFIEEGSQQVREDMEVLRPICSAAAASADSTKHALQTSGKVDRSEVLRTIESYLREHQLDISSTTLQLAMDRQKELVLREVHGMLDNSRVEAGSMMDILRQQVDVRMLELASGVKDSREVVTRTKNGVKELAGNVAKALSKKADRGDVKEVKRQIQGQQEHLELLEQQQELDREKSFALAATMTALPRHGHGPGLKSSNSNSSHSTGSEKDAKDTHTYTTATSASAPSSLGEKLNRVMSDYSSVTSDMTDLRNTQLEVRAEVLRIDRFVEALRGEMTAMAVATQAQTQAQTPVAKGSGSGSGSGRRGSVSGSGGGGEKEKGAEEWRVVMGEHQQQVRRDMADKPSREEMFAAVRQEYSRLDSQVASLYKKVEGGARAGTNSAASAAALAGYAASSGAEVASVLEKVESLDKAHRKMIADVNGARWLWTNSERDHDGMVAWDVQVMNPSPSSIIWTAGTTSVRARTPGLYKITCSVFTTAHASVQISLNFETILAVSPPVSSDADEGEEMVMVSGGGGRRGSGGFLSSLQVPGAVRRTRHPAGEVTCVTIDEYVSLPAESVLAVRITSGDTATQAMLALRKL